jgi:hypothetical protein
MLPPTATAYAHLFRIKSLRTRLLIAGQESGNTVADYPMNAALDCVETDSRLRHLLVIVEAYARTVNYKAL